MADRKTRLGASGATFDSMIRRFGVVTVMNAKVYDTAELAGNKDIASYFKEITVYGLLNSLEAEEPLCVLDTLKIANISQDGPTKTVSGGQYSNPLIKFGKTARLEMQDALGNAEALDALCGTITEKNGELIDAVYVSEDFNGPRTIVGDTFFIDQKSGQQVKVKIIFFQFLPDSIFNLTQDAEGDATVFDMNGDLMTTVIKVSDNTGALIEHGMTYTIVNPDADDVKGFKAVLSNSTLTITMNGLTSGFDVYVNDNKKEGNEVSLDPGINHVEVVKDKKIVFSKTYVI